MEESHAEDYHGNCSDDHDGRPVRLYRSNLACLTGRAGQTADLHLRRLPSHPGNLGPNLGTRHAECRNPVPNTWRRHLNAAMVHGLARGFSVVRRRGRVFVCIDLPLRYQLSKEGLHKKPGTITERVISSRAPFPSLDQVLPMFRQESAFKTRGGSDRHGFFLNSA